MEQKIHQILCHKLLILPKFKFDFINFNLLETLKFYKIYNIMNIGNRMPFLQLQNKSENSSMNKLKNKSNDYNCKIFN